MAECLFCKAKVGANDFLPSEQAACSVCGQRSSLPPAAEPWWVAAAASEQKAPAITQLAAEPNEPKAPPKLAAPPPPLPPIASNHSPPPPRVEPADDEDDEDEPPSLFDRARRLDYGSALALFCFSVALLFNSFYTLEPFIKPLAAVGLLAGLLGGTLPALWRRRNVILPLLVSILCLLVLLFAASWPSFSPPSPPLVLVPLNQKGMATHQSADADQWVDAAANAVKLGDVRVQIESVKIGPVELKRKSSSTTSADRYLIIRLRVSNESILFQRTPYEPWADRDDAPSKYPPTLTDDQDRAYTQKIFASGTKVVGRAEGDVLNPGHQVKEVLVYPSPARDVKQLRLMLPASAFGLDGAFRFQIHRSMIRGL